MNSATSDRAASAESPRVAGQVATTPPATGVNPSLAAPRIDDQSCRENLEKVRGVLSTFRSVGILSDSRNWLTIHSLLLFGDTAYHDAKKSPPLHTLFDRMLRPSPEATEPAFVLRSGQPYPRHSGDRFNQEHHRDQFLAKFGLSGVPLDAPLFVGGSKHTVKDLLERSLLDITFEGEISWSVSAYSHYLTVGQTWRNKLGQEMSLSRLTEALLTEKNLPCGGSHNFFGMSRVVSNRELRNDPEMARLMPRLQRRLEDEVLRLRAGQRGDGSLPPPSPMREQLEHSATVTPYVNGVWYTGHTMEWIAVGLPAERLREDWVLRAVSYLVRGLEIDFQSRMNTGLRNDEERFAYGYMAHAISGLHRWQSKVLAASIDRPGNRG